MIHLTTRPYADGLELFFQLAGNKTLSYVVRRTVIGVCFPTTLEGGRPAPGYTCVVAERMFYGDDPDTQPERQYVVIDESRPQTLQGLFSATIAHKDRYLASTVFFPNKPAQAVDALKRLEGLTHYLQEHPISLRERFPSFVSTQTTAGVRDVDVDVQQAHRDIEELMSRDVIHPDGRVPILTGGGQLTRKLICVKDLPTQEALAGIMRQDPQVCTALWLAAMGLERSGVWRGNYGQERKKSRITGY